MDTSIRNILITGASRGIGYETALALAAPDTRLILHARSASALNDIAAACQAKGAQTVIWPLDLADVPAMMFH